MVNCQPNKIKKLYVFGDILIVSLFQFQIQKPITDVKSTYIALFRLQLLGSLKRNGNMSSHRKLNEDVGLKILF